MGGRNPAPVAIWFIPLFIRFQPSKVVQDFFHPQSLLSFSQIKCLHTFTSSILFPKAASSFSTGLNSSILTMINQVISTRCQFLWNVFYTLYMQKCWERNCDCWWKNIYFNHVLKSCPHSFSPSFSHFSPFYFSLLDDFAHHLHRISDFWSFSPVVAVAISSNCLFLWIIHILHSINGLKYHL